MNRFLPEEKHTCSLCSKGEGEHDPYDRRCEKTYFPHGSIPDDKEILDDKKSTENWDEYYYRVSL